MSDRCTFDYAVLRLVPRVELEEFFNVGVILSCPAFNPKKELLPPVVFESPAAIPANKFEVPGLLSMRKPPMLYCVAALTVVADRVPPAVPLPLMLKLLDAC